MVRDKLVLRRKRILLMLECHQLHLFDLIDDRKHYLIFYKK